MTTSDLKVFVPIEHLEHRPRLDFSDGLPGFPHLDVPNRVEVVLAGLLDCASCEVKSVASGERSDVEGIHDPGYVRYLAELCDELSDAEDYIPPIFQPDLTQAPVRFRGGMYCRDIGTPVNRGTLSAGLASARSAMEAAQAICNGDWEAVALCRPPGHHARRGQYGGYCFFNNAYIAATLLSRAGRCGVLDIDYHLGDGSLELAQPSLPYFSLHADPVKNFPYVAPAEARLDHGCGVLKELQAGVGISEYLEALDSLLETLQSYDLRFLVLSLGFDTLGSDYIQDELIDIRSEDFEPIGARIGALGLPTAIVLEGGYEIAELAASARAFFSGFLGAR